MTWKRIHRALKPYYIFAVLLALWYIEWALGLWFFITTVALYYISRMFVKEFKKIEQEEQLS